MKNEVRYLKSEETVTTTSSKYPSKIFQKIHKICLKLINLVFTNPHEIQVVQKSDRQGNTYWQVYDPGSGKSFCSGSESDVLAWIEYLYKYR
jgi:hypothetical protein